MSAVTDIVPQIAGSGYVFHRSHPPRPCPEVFAGYPAIKPAWPRRQ